MRLALENVGKILEADIEIQGITVIAGENNTGKSTLGKMLYSIYDTFYMIEEQIEEERNQAVRSAIRLHYREMTDKSPRLLSDLSEFVSSMVDKRNEYLEDVGRMKKELTSYFIRRSRISRENLAGEIIERLAKTIYDILCVEDEVIEEALLRKRLEAEFGMKVGYLNSPDEATRVQLKIKNRQIAFTVQADKELKIREKISLIKEISYIDDPFVLDEMKRERYFYINMYNHRNNLCEKLKRQRKEYGTLDELVVNKKLKNIFRVMNKACDGELVLSEEENGFAYRTPRLNGELTMANLSTGLKSFVILRTLLGNGSISDNGIIIMDEPEIHLHPEWQLIFAEIIVLLQREFGLNILINTHSPYFLNAIEVYAKVYGIVDKCRYYLTNEVGGRTNLADVTTDTERIYQKLARPLQDLENLEFS